MKSVNQDSKHNLKTTILLTLAFVLTAIVGATFAYFRTQSGNGTNVNIDAISGTTDDLMFVVGNAINITADQDTFAQGAGDRNGKTTATAILTPNDATKKAARKYNVFFILGENTLDYVTDSKDIELLLKVTDPEDQPVEKILGLHYDEDLGGFDITNKKQTAYRITPEGGYDIVANGGKVEQTWNVEVILRNLNEEQDDNQGKSLNGSLLITTDDEDTYTLATLNDITISSKSENSITASLNYVNGSAKIDKYYYKIEETEEEISPVAFAYEPKEGFSEYKEATQTFTKLKSNQKYKISGYIVDENGYESEVKSKVVQTNYIEPKVSIAESHETTSITIKATGTKGSTEITNYYFKIYQDESLAESTQWQDNNLSTSKTFDGLTSNTKYYVQAKVQDVEGHTAESEVLEITTDYEEPSIEKIEVIERGWNSLKVEVTAKGGSSKDLTYYYAIDSNNFGESKKDNTFEFTDLSESSNHNITVKVEDSNKHSVLKTIENEKTRAYKEPEVTASITEIKEHSFKVTANGTGYDGTITSYKFEITSGETDGEKIKTISSSSGNAEVEFTDLKSDTEYTVTVTVTDNNNRTGTTTVSDKTAYEKVAINGVSTSQTWNSVTLSVTAKPGTNEITNYYFKKATDESWIDNQNNPTYTFTGLDEKQTIKFEVKVKDAGNQEVTYEEEISVTTSEYNKPTFTYGTEIKWNSIKVNIAAKTNQDDATITNYYFTLGEGSEKDNGNNSSITYTEGIIDKQTYTIKVRVKDSNNKYSEVSTINVQTPEYKLPTVNASIEPDTITADGFTIKVTGKALEENTTIQKYEFSLNGTDYETDLTETTTETNITKKITGKPSNTSYIVKVKITDSNDRTSESTEVSVKTAYIEPKAEIVNSSSTWNTITVEGKGIAGSGTIKYYSFQQGSTGWTNWEEIKDATKNFTHIFDVGLDAGIEYAIQVKVKDENGHESEPSAITKVRTKDYVYPTISDFGTSDITTNSMKVSATVTGHDGNISEVYFQRSSTTDWIKADTISGSTYSKVFTGLTPGETYTFKIKVVDSNKTKEYTEPTAKGTTTKSNVDLLLAAAKSMNKETQGYFLKHDGTIISNIDKLANNNKKTYTVMPLAAPPTDKQTTPAINSDAGDNSYRYSGNNPNNFVCFGPGSEAYNLGISESCPLNNQYRIIGLFDENKNGTYQIKLIKSEYVTNEELNRNDTSSKSSTSYSNARIQTKSGISNFWYNSGNGGAMWFGNSLNSSLNNTYLTNLGQWNEKIANYNWRTRGDSNKNLFSSAKVAYDAEFSGDGDYEGKVGLMYANEYGFAASPEYWQYTMEGYSKANDYNWLYNGIEEWTISPTLYGYDGTVIYINSNGDLNHNYFYPQTYAVRPVFYLNEDVMLNTTGVDGSFEKPFKVEGEYIAITNVEYDSSISYGDKNVIVHATGGTGNYTYSYKDITTGICGEKKEGEIIETGSSAEMTISLGGDPCSDHIIIIIVKDDAGNSAQYSFEINYDRNLSMCGGGKTIPC